jgi:hypothetical protein
MIVPPNISSLPWMLVVSEINSLGLFKDYGWLIIFFCVIFYMGWYIYLNSEYGESYEDE